jgi:hypothetical protein
MSSSIEKEFYYLITEIDLRKKCDFHDFLTPIETCVNGLKPHLQMKKNGLIVSTGTERALFDVILSDERCEGLVVIDINPKVKAYLDFNLFLLKASENRAEYLHLSTSPTAFRSKITKLKSPMQEYYASHLEQFATIYFSQTHAWRKNKVYDVVNYTKNDELFHKLQTHALAENIISIVGDIGDIDFLKNRNIEIIDESNISQYSLPLYKIDSNPRLLMTIKLPLHRGGGWSYISNPSDRVPHRFIRSIVS